VLDTLDEINLTQEQRDFLAGIDNVALRQTTRDHIIDQQFRRDLFVKGPVRLSPQLVREKWLDTRFALSARNDKIPREVRGMRHTMKLQSAVYDPLIAALEQGPRSLREIAGEPALAKITVSRLIQAITVLAAAGVCHPCLPDQGLAERKRRTDRFNRVVAEHARFERKFGSFASPVTAAASRRSA
jgi:hypothetical protein